MRFFADDDTRVKLVKGKNDYVNANYVTVSFKLMISEMVTWLYESMRRRLVYGLTHPESSIAQW